MFEVEKSDHNLGQEIQKALIEKGIQTPWDNNGLTEKEKISIIENHFREIMNTLGLDLTDDSLMDTPKRVAKMFVNEVFGVSILPNFLNVRRLKTLWLIMICF